MIRHWVVDALSASVLAAALLTAPAKADLTDVFDCSADVGDPVSGSLSWDLADQNNRWCASEGPRTAAGNPAYYAAVAANAAQGSFGAGDPFRALVRWAGMRGDYQELTWTDRGGVVHAGALFGPLDAGDDPSPGVVVVCHACSAPPPFPMVPVPGAADGYRWMPEVLAEHGYIVFFADVAGNNVPGTVDATDWFVSTPNAPSPHGENEFNPWHERLDRTRLGIVGHSGAGGVSLNVGNLDDRYGAVVAFDPAGPDLEELDLGTPAMIQVADYEMAGHNVAWARSALPAPVPLAPVPVTLYEPRHSKPVPAPGSKFTIFDTFRNAGVDTMQVALRASTHAEWSGATASPAQVTGGSLYGETVATYYMLSWFDYHLRGSQAALGRLIGTSTFDEFADGYASGAGIFDALKAVRAGDLEAGNVPVTIGGLSIRNRLSWWYPTRFFLGGAALECEDVRAACP